jgi:hypothetical protein
MELDLNKKLFLDDVEELCFHAKEEMKECQSTLYSTNLVLSFIKNTVIKKIPSFILYHIVYIYKKITPKYYDNGGLISYQISLYNVLSDYISDISESMYRNFIFPNDDIIIKNMNIPPVLKKIFTKC